MRITSTRDQYVSLLPGELENETPQHNQVITPPPPVTLPPVPEEEEIEAYSEDEGFEGDSDLLIELLDTIVDALEDDPEDEEELEEEPVGELSNPMPPQIGDSLVGYDCYGEPVEGVVEGFAFGKPVVDGKAVDEYEVTPQAPEAPEGYRLVPASKTSGFKPGDRVKDRDGLILTRGDTEDQWLTPIGLNSGDSDARVEEELASGELTRVESSKKSAGIVSPELRALDIEQLIQAYDYAEENWNFDELPELEEAIRERADAGDPDALNFCESLDVARSY